ncbi:hypothetical protein ACMA5I_10285 [Paracoccaceae bacterium GXU_MW_L88]
MRASLAGGVVLSLAFEDKAFHVWAVKLIPNQKNERYSLSDSRHRFNNSVFAYLYAKE